MNMGDRYSKGMEPTLGTSMSRSRNISPIGYGSFQHVSESGDR
jgi:hypothetical protein